jgi:RNA-directed DNA polymerase
MAGNAIEERYVEFAEEPGTSLSASISLAMSRKGPWRLARTLATQTGKTNKWLKAQGLLSVKELWVNIHNPATAR